MNKSLVSLTIALSTIILVGAGCSSAGVGKQQQQQNTPSTQVTPSTQSTAPAENTSKTFTMTEVASHNSASSCYTAVNGSVYDVTNWINQHPGGAGAILSMCGKDSTSAFEGQHGGQRRPESELASFKIGTLAQ